jgi:hypothetical protein
MDRPEEIASYAVAFLVTLIVAGKTIVAHIEFGLGILSLIKVRTANASLSSEG